MSRKLALKKLKASDLSFFQTHLVRYPQAKQKAFNLDQRVFEQQFFPSLTAALDATTDKRAGVALTFFGPGGSPPHQLMRKVLKQQKNWRLNGEAIYSPDEDPARYDVLAPEDIAIMEFTGVGVPTTIKVVLLAAADPIDAATHAELSAAFPAESMTVISEDQIERAILAAATPLEHPIRDWLDKEVLEEVVHGDADAADRLLKKRKGRSITAEELNKAKEAAEKVGRLGEELLDYHFGSARPADVKSCEWVSNINAISPFDFRLTIGDGTERHLDAKSTGGDFSSPLYMSLSEMRHAVSSGVPYDLYRLYNVTDTGALMRVATSIASKLLPILDHLTGLPEGVRVNALSFSPEFFDFDATELSIAYPEEAG